MAPIKPVVAAAQAFPVAALGPVLADAARAIARFTQAPVEIAAHGVLAVAALAAQERAHVMLPGRGPRPLTSFFLTVAESGERTSTANDLAVLPVVRREQVLAAAYEARYAAYTAALRGPAAGRPTQCPARRPRLWCEQTLAGLERHWNSRAALGLSAGYDGVFGGGPVRRRRDATFLCALWDGEMRAGRAADACRTLSLHLTVSPREAKALFSDAVLNDRGTMGRFLTVYPPTRIGSRVWEGVPEVPALDSYDAGMAALFEAAATSEARGLPFAPGAGSAWLAFAADVERAMAADGAYESIRALAARLPDHAARLAAVLALAADPDAAEIAAEAADRGIALARHYAHEAIRLFAPAGAVSPAPRRADLLLRWLLEKHAGKTVSLRSICRNGPLSVRESQTACRAMGDLERLGYVVPATNPANSFQRLWEVLSAVEEVSHGVASPVA